MFPVCAWLVQCIVNIATFIISRARVGVSGYNSLEYVLLLLATLAILDLMPAAHTGQCVCAGAKRKALF